MNKWIIALAVILPTLIEVIDTSVVNVSLDHIRGSLSAGLDESTWTITAYLVSNAIIIPLAGWLARVFGRKRYLIFSVGLFTVSSFLCGSSTTLGSLIFFRILQGIGGGALQPLSQAILLETFPPAQYGMAMAVFGIGIMTGPIIGPVLGGWITDNWSWNWIFYINIPIGIISILMIMAYIKDPHYLDRSKKTIDYWGLVFITVGLGCLQVVLDKGQRDDWFSSEYIVKLSIISAVCLIAFVITELRVKHPVLNIRVFKDISFASANFIQFTAFFVLFGSLVILPIFLQQLMGYNAYLAGLALAPGGIATLIVMPFAGKMITKVSPKILLVTGLFITAFSVYMMMKFNLYVDFDTVAFSRIVMGIGMGLVFIPLTSMAFATIPKEEMGNATSAYNLLRNLGGSFGIAFVTTVLAQRAQFHQARFSEQLNPFDLNFQTATFKAAHLLGPAASDTTVNGVVYQQLLKQSSLFAFMDAFYLCTMIMLAIIPLVLLLKRAKKSANVMVH